MSGAAPASSDCEVIHLVELDGRGGPYQHAVGLADALHRAGLDVVLHTATDAELDPTEPIDVCPCMDWCRSAGSARRAVVAARFLTVTLPHLLRHRRVLHLQGPFRPALLVIALGAARCRGDHVVFSPHNTFSRRGSALDARLVRLGTRLAHATVVFSESDAGFVTGWGGRAVISPLLPHVPVVDPARVDAWRHRWGGAPIVLFAGQIRRDKRLDLLIEASGRWTRARRLAIVGADLGDADRCRALAERLAVHPDWSVGYLELGDFAAAVKAADVVVCPYERASQSGVLALAHQLGVPTVATDIGGLGELASTVVPVVEGPDRLAQAIDDLLASPPTDQGFDLAEATVAAHRLAYGAGGREGSHGPV